MANDNDDNKSHNYEGIDEEELKKRGLSITDIAKKVFAVGIGAAFLTEESIRIALSEIKLPKDILNTVIQNATKTREVISNQVANEIIKIISKIDFVKEASRFVEEHKFRISAEVEVLKKKNGDGHDVSFDIKTKK